jgi:hypothetical protein
MFELTNIIIKSRRNKNQIKNIFKNKNANIKYFIKLFVIS